MDKYLLDLANALIAVNPAHFRIQGLNLNDEVYNQNAENNFTSHLVGKFRNNMELPTQSEYYNFLNMDFDINKMRYHFRPDFVLHENNTSLRHQVILGEVKVNPSANLQEDLNNLLFAISHELHFKNAVMVCINKTYKNASDQVIQFFEDNNLWDEPQKASKLWLFHARISPNGTPQYKIENFLSTYYNN